MPRVNTTGPWRRTQKWRITNSIDTVMDISVAMAAPLMPRPSAHTNSGARRMFSPHPTNIVAMAFIG